MTGTVRGRAYAAVGWLGAVALGCALAGCTQVKGQVLDAQTKAPLTGVTFTGGRPDSISVFARHKVDSEGRFDFSIAPTDEQYLYLWDGQGNPELHAMHIDPTQISNHMKIFYHRAGVEDW